jgi:hypothetical protein
MKNGKLGEELCPPGKNLTRVTATSMVDGFRLRDYWAP